MSDINFSNLDINREKRRGFGEAVLCECKTTEWLISIFREFSEHGQNVIGTRATREQFESLKKEFETVKYDETARVLSLVINPVPKIGEIAVCTGGTGDVPVAEEAASVAEFYGSNVKKYYDIGIAGINRLLEKIDEIKRANVIITVAGMEGALGSVISGLVDVPVIAVPTSVGYGASFGGISALLTMLNSCSEGMTVVNIDNGFNAGYCANQINRLIVNGRK